VIVRYVALFRVILLLFVVDLRCVALRLLPFVVAFTRYICCCLLLCWLLLRCVCCCFPTLPRLLHSRLFVVAFVTFTYVVVVDFVLLFVSFAPVLFALLRCCCCLRCCWLYVFVGFSFLYHVYVVVVGCC